MKKLLYRSYRQKVFTGLLGGIGEFLEINPNLIRVFFILALFLSRSFFLLPLAYISLSILIPSEVSYNTESIQYYGNNGKMYYKIEEDATDKYEKNVTTQKNIGFVLIFIGLIFLSDIFIVLSPQYIFPIILIIVGFSVITLKDKR